MTRLPVQATRFERLQRQLAGGLFGGLRGNWRRRSLGLLALLFGFFCGQNLTAYWYQRVGERPLVVLVLLVLLEVVVRLRTRVVAAEPGLGWLMADNLRIGLVYAVVLEAFKLGS
ncbi:MAG: DUF565 domain-containing protein [Synechococcaceae bacterium WB8_1B_136]|nr:DUF565 domain-containing protein [Synechococcaceae bacterium WB8_1B_136]